MPRRPRLPRDRARLITTPELAGAPEPPAPPACGRCGAFEPLDADGHCAPCVDRLVHPIVKEPATVGSVLRGTGWLLAKVGPAAALVVVALDLPYALLSLGREVPFTVSNLYDAFVSIVGTGAVTLMAQRLLSGDERLGLWQALRAAAGRWGTLVGANFFSGLSILGYLLLLVVPGILKWLSLALVVPAVMAGASSSGALDRSEALMKGHRGQAFAIYLVTAVPLVAVLFLVLAAAVLSEVAEVPEADAERAVDLALGVLGPLCVLPSTLATVVLHAKLERASRAP